MIKKLYKKIRLYFIDKNIKRIVRKEHNWKRELNYE